MDWKKIKAEYIAGGISYRKLAEKHGVSFNTLKTRAKEEQWYELRQQKDLKTTTKIVETISNNEAKKATDLSDLADKLLAKISEVIEKVENTKDIKNLTSAIKDLKEIKGCKSEADIREQEARIKKLQKEAERDDDTTNEIEVVFKAGEEDWNG